MKNLVKALPKQLRKNGYDYSQVLKGKRAYIYAQHISPTMTRYEVFQIKTRPAKRLFGKEVEAREIFPPDEAFGYWAWCCWDLEKAKAKFNELERGCDG
jgi:hypothetical protein